MTWRSLATAASVVALASLPAASARADVITVWNEQVVTSGGPQSQRTFAMVAVAMFDAVNAIQGGYTPYLALPAPPPGASAEAAAAAAARGVLFRLFPAQQASLDALLATSLAGVPDGPAKADGVAFGDLVAQAMYEARLNDGILAPGPAFVDGTAPGEYRLTSPGPPQPVNTGASSWRPFAMTSAAQFRPGPPPPLNTLAYAVNVNLTKAWGGAASSLRSSEHEQIARWHTEMAQFQFNRIARSEVVHDGRGLLAHARLFALLNLALADATTAVFDAKYTYRYWRPSTAIQNADSDGNRLTKADATWTPFLPTPPHPEYPAAHGAVQGAGAVVLSWYFGPHHRFATTSPTVPGVTRHYQSFAQFALEGAAARIFGGMHFVRALEVGSWQGQAVGAWVLSHHLRPARRR
jgi:hypothetical protein